MSNNIGPNSVSSTASPASRRSSSLWRGDAIWIKPLFFIIALIPLAALTHAVITGNAGANPVETVEHETGEWALRFLLLSLCASPITRQFKWLWPIRLRRMIGLFAFFYVCCHLLAYLWFDHAWVWRDIFNEFFDKPFITAGVLCFLVLLPLAITSNRWSVRTLGKRWKALHNWVYFAAMFAVLHYVWLAKGDRIEPVVYLVITCVLLAFRLPESLKRSKD